MSKTQTTVTSMLKNMLRSMFSKFPCFPRFFKRQQKNRFVISSIPFAKKNPLTVTAI